jgi:hypothetical protein
MSSKHNDLMNLAVFGDFCLILAKFNILFSPQIYLRSTFDKNKQFNGIFIISFNVLTVLKRYRHQGDKARVGKNCNLVQNVACNAWMLFNLQVF